MTSPTTTSRAATSQLSADSVSLLRALLLCELTSHAGQAADARMGSSELTGHSGVEDLLARGDAESAASRADTAIIDIEDALGRLDDHRYGACERCGVSIPFERLEVIPHARLWVVCPVDRRGLVS